MTLNDLEKGDFLKTAFSPFPTMFFLTTKQLSTSSHIYFAVCKGFQFRLVYNLLFGKQLTLSLPNEINCSFSLAKNTLLLQDKETVQI